MKNRASKKSVGKKTAENNPLPEISNSTQEPMPSKSDPLVMSLFINIMFHIDLLNIF